MKDLTHDNMNRFIGACLGPPHVCIVNNYCSRGSLEVKLNLIGDPSQPFVVVFLSFVTKITFGKYNELFAQKTEPKCDAVNA